MLPSREHRVRQSPQWTRLGHGLSINPVLSTLRGSKRPFKWDLTNINACSQVLAAGEWLHLRALSLTKMGLSAQRPYLWRRGHAPLRRTSSWLLKMTESHKFAGYRKWTPIGK